MSAMGSRHQRIKGLTWTPTTAQEAQWASLLWFGTPPWKITLLITRSRSPANAREATWCTRGVRMERTCSGDPAGPLGRLKMPWMIGWARSNTTTTAPIRARMAKSAATTRRWCGRPPQASAALRWLALAMLPLTSSAATIHLETTSEKSPTNCNLVLDDWWFCVVWHSTDPGLLGLVHWGSLMDLQWLLFPASALLLGHETRD